MTTEPFYEPRILEMPLEKYVKMAIDGGLWLAGELLAQGYKPGHSFNPDPSFTYRPRQQETAIIELCQVGEDLRHRIFIAGFLMSPHDGSQGTFRRLLVTHAEILNEVFRIEWERRLGRMIDVSDRPHLQRQPPSAAIELLHKIGPPR